jgi:hypothetical protein
VSDLNPYRPPTAPLDDLPSRDATAACPKCNATSASKVSFTWWGGALGPKLFSVVKCHQCGAQYNGKTGATLTKVIIGYQAVALVVFGGIWLWLRKL